MKHQILFFALCFIVMQSIHAQIMNTFPLNDSVGIGTTEPLDLLDVRGNILVGYKKISANEQFLAFGFNALEANETGTGASNTAIGNYSMQYNISGSKNTALGIFSLQNNTKGSGNTAVGMFSLAGNVRGNYNTAVGFYAMSNGGAGSYNIAMGTSALPSCSKGNYNIAIGSGSLSNTSIGDYNVGVGNSSLSTNAKGNYNIGLGESANTSSDNLTNATVIGYNAIVDASNKVRIGNSSVTSNGGQVSWTAYSDARIKNNVKENVPGLEFINLLKPITYHFDVNKQNELAGIKGSNVEGMYDIEQIEFTGFIAQDVDAAAQQINYNFSGADKSGDIMGLRYAEFTVPLVKAVQELDEKISQLANVQISQLNEIQMENAELKMSNEQLVMNVNDLENRIEKLEQLITSSTFEQNNTTTQKVSLDNDDVATLGQNIPNPFTGKTIIQYYVPVNITKAQIQITNANGVILKTIDVTAGNGQLEIDAAKLTSGNYQYSLIIDGRIVETKTMSFVK